MNSPACGPFPGSTPPGGHLPPGRSRGERGRTGHGRPGRLHRQRRAGPVRGAPGRPGDRGGHLLARRSDRTPERPADAAAGHRPPGERGDRRGSGHLRPGHQQPALRTRPGPGAARPWARPRLGRGQRRARDRGPHLLHRPRPAQAARHPADGPLGPVRHRQDAATADRRRDAGRGRGPDPHPLRPGAALPAAVAARTGPAGAGRDDGGTGRHPRRPRPAPTRSATPRNPAGPAHPATPTGP